MTKQQFLGLLKTMGRWLEASGLFFGRKKASPISSTEMGLGFKGEQVAARYLRQLGFRIIESGHRQRLGEIDLIAVDGNCIVFVEVKTWKSDADQDPSMAVSRSKQEKLTRAGLIYLRQHRLLESPARFDVVSIVWDGNPASHPRIRHFPNAFEATGRGQLFS